MCVRRKKNDLIRMRVGRAGKLPGPLQPTRCEPFLNALVCIVWVETRQHKYNWQILSSQHNIPALVYIRAIYIYSHTHTRKICTCIFTEQFWALRSDEGTCILKSGRCVNAFMRKDTVSWVYRCGRMRSKMFRKYRRFDKNKSVDFISITLRRSWSWNIEQLSGAILIYICKRASFFKSNNVLFTGLNDFY